MRSCQFTGGEDTPQAPVMGLAELAVLAEEYVRVAGPCGVNAAVKVPCLVAGMVAGAASIDDLDVLRHGAMGEVFARVRAPSTLGFAGCPRGKPGTGSGVQRARVHRIQHPSDGRLIGRLEPAGQGIAPVVGW